MKLFDKYLKLRPYYIPYDDNYTSYEKQYVIRLVEKPWFTDMKYEGYLFSPKKMEIDKFDEIDKEFDGKTFGEIVEKIKIGKYALLQFTGIHTCGGYYAYFRPDLKEVCDIIPDYVFEKFERIYITTNFVKNVSLFDEDIGITTAICYPYKN